MQRLYRMHDTDPSGMIEVKPSEANEWNKKGFGIFITVNSFRGKRRIENLEKILAWAVDIDAGSKDEMLETIRRGLVPSIVIETKRGFHVWFKARNANPQHWNSIVLDRLVPFYGADKNARDICRVLRAPGYFHMKDPADPFLVEKVWQWDVSYTEEQIANFYPDQSKPEREEFVERQKTEFKSSGDFWERVWRLDCQEFLMRLSGHPEIGGETYEFKPTTQGKFNIAVNGKLSSCWIDANGRIGSLSGGGPSAYSWLRWFGIAPARAVEIIKELFPEIETCSK